MTKCLSGRLLRRQLVCPVVLKESTIPRSEQVMLWELGLRPQVRTNTAHLRATPLFANNDGVIVSPRPLSEPLRP